MSMKLIDVRKISGTSIQIRGLFLNAVQITRLKFYFLIWDDETQDPTVYGQAQNQSHTEVLKELRELKELVKDVKKKQREMEKTMHKLANQLKASDFELAKSSHAVIF